MQKALDAAYKLIADLKSQIVTLTQGLSKYKSVRSRLNTANVEQENEVRIVWLNPIGKSITFHGCRAVKKSQKSEVFMKTGLTKKQKTTSIFFCEDSSPCHKKEKRKKF